MKRARCVTWRARVLGATLLAGAAATAAAQDGDSAAQGPVEDLSGTVSASLGGEARVRYEGFEAPAWGDGPDDGYLWLRLMPLAKIEEQTGVIVVQPIIGYAIGVAGGAGPVDRTGFDLAQAFVELRQPLGEDAKVSLRAGRGLIALGSERLVGTRYGPNIPQPFEGVQMSLAGASAQLDIVDARAVLIGTGDFDDSSKGGRRLRSIYLTAEAAHDVSFDFYWIGYNDAAARFGGLIAVEARDTFGLRLFGARGRVAWNWETMIQRGSFDGRSIRAWSQATETTISFSGAQVPAQLRLRANIASGDHAGTAGKIESFNAMFPKGRYFGEITPLGPRNIINVNPGLILAPMRGVELEINLAAFWRASRSDGIYDLAGREIRATGTTRARHIGNLAEASLSFDLDNGLSLTASLGAFVDGPFIRQSGAGRTIVMVAGEATYRF
jgi:hypothetical protein